jgi:hypothetical protein
MRMRSLRRGNEAVASSIGTMLAILVVLALLTMVVTSWAPEWTKGKESEHMRNVEAQFSSLKALMDQLALSGQVETVVSSPITLGSEGVPLFSGDSTGTISLISSDSNTSRFHRFSVQNSTGRYTRVAYGTIMYTSENTEYLDQDFIYECGAIIIRQDRGELITTGPGLVIQNLSGRLSVTTTMMSVASDGSTYTGAGTIGVQCRLVKEKITTERLWPGNETVYINVTSVAYEAWYDYFARLVPEGEVGAGDYDLTVDPDAFMVYLELRNVSKLVTDYVLLGASLDIS